jgi:hypothetical protein
MAEKDDHSIIILTNLEALLELTFPHSEYQKKV